MAVARDWEGEHPSEAIAFNDEELAVHIIQSVVAGLKIFTSCIWYNTR